MGEDVVILGDGILGALTKALQACCDNILDWAIIVIESASFFDMIHLVFMEAVH